MRELNGYRENIELISSIFPGRGALTIAEAATYLSISERMAREKLKTCTLFSGRDTRVTIVDLAKFCCEH